MGDQFTDLAYRAALVARYFLGWSSDDRLSRLGFSICRDGLSFAIFLSTNLVMETASARTGLHYGFLDSGRFSLVCA